jgi:integrase
VKRRAHGEGSLYYWEEKALWVGQIILPTGKKRVKYTKTQKEAKDWLHTQKEAVKSGNWVEQENITLADYLDRYMSDVAAHTLRPKTLEAYEYLVRLHIKPELGAIKLSALRPDQLQNLYSVKLNSGLSRRTVQFIHSVLHKSLDQAYKWGLVTRNVSDLVDPPSVKRHAPVTFSPAQVKQLLASCRKDRMYPILALAVSCGLREGEVLGIFYEDIDWKNNTIHIQHAVQYLIGKGLIITEPKTDKARRTIAVPDFVMVALKQHCDSQNTNQGLIFKTSNGTPFSPRNVIRYFKQTLEKAGLPEIRFHDLRHTAATLLLSEGVHPKVVQEMLGHSQINLTLDTYSHVLPSMQQEASEKMNGLLKV